jgi:hypothetical protein
MTTAKPAGMRWNPPPGWPEVPTWWAPEPGWRPDPAWGPAPAGWQFWVPDGTGASTPVGFGPPSASVGSPSTRMSPRAAGLLGFALGVVVTLGALLSVGLYFETQQRSLLSQAAAPDDLEEPDAIDAPNAVDAPVVEPAEEPLPSPSLYYPPSGDRDGSFVLEQVRAGEFGTGNLRGEARIRNVGQETLTGVFTITFFDDQDNAVGSITGSATDVEPGRTVTVERYGDGGEIPDNATYEFQVDAEGTPP